MTQYAQEPDLKRVAGLYNDRFHEFGRDIKTVGWVSAKSQALRFEVLFRGLDLIGKTILDVGCGLGGLVPYLEERTKGDFLYIGIDVAETLVADATSSYGRPGREFHAGDIFNVVIPAVDIAVLSGALSYRSAGMEEYAYATMRRMYEVARIGACLNFLSKYVDYELEKNQHYQPEVVFSRAKTITPRVNIFHDYPLYEFTVQLLKPERTDWQKAAGG